MKNVQSYIPTYPRHVKEGTCDISGFLAEGTLTVCAGSTQDTYTIMHT